MRNAGHTITNARWEAGNFRDVLAYYAGAPERLFGRQIPVAGGVDITFFEPLGVVGVIVPWNFPMPIASWGAVPALAAGNTVVLKPADLTPLTAIRIGEILLEAGIPEDVFQVLPGQGSVVGWRFVTHPKVRKICFTGSTAVGKKIMAGCADQLKRVTLELGGKSANIVFSDADLARAAEAAPSSVFDNAGQDCCARSRLLVQRSVYDRFLELLEPAVKAFRVGEPSDEATEMGPLISAGQRESVQSFVGEGPRSPFAGPLRRERGTGSPRRSSPRCRPRRRPSPRRSSGPSCRWCRSRTRPTQCGSPTTPSTGCPARSSRATSGGRCVSPRALETGTISVNSHRRCGTGRRSEVTSSRDWDGSWGRMLSRVLGGEERLHRHGSVSGAAAQADRPASSDQRPEKQNRGATEWDGSTARSRSSPGRQAGSGGRAPGALPPRAQRSSSPT